MKVFYQSAFLNEELSPGDIFRTLPSKASLEIQGERNDDRFDLIYNETLIPEDSTQIECNEYAELIVRRKESREVFSVRPLVPPLSNKYARAYEQFAYEYRKKKSNEIDSIQSGYMKLYAVEQSTDIVDYSETFKKIEEAFSDFKYICEKPKSHLRAVNEVRPIETVKRIGYESIPYLASHSEDWLARTASGLKPARLFSRVEDDEFQIYENRVVKTLIDLIISFLRRTEKQLRDKRDQLRGIINSSVQIGSFGFDVSFQKAVSELMSSDQKGDEYRSKSLELAEKLQKKAYTLLKKYRTLRKTRLYRYLKNAKPVQNPINETNILVMDKHYSVIFRLWKTIHIVIAPRMDEEEYGIAFDDICDAYQKYCAALCGYAAHVLNFELIEDGKYYRKGDQIQLSVRCEDDGSIKAELSDREQRSVEVPKTIDIPIESSTESHGFSFDGTYLRWPNDTSDDEIEAFCNLFKTRESRGKVQAEEKRKYKALKQFLDQTQRSYKQSMKTTFAIIPVVVELGTENRATFKNAIEQIVAKYREINPADEIVVGLPICNENEQKLTEYAKELDQEIAILPLTMFDINSFRRIQNILYRHIIKFEKDRCVNCGGRIRVKDNQKTCDECNQLTLTKTTCPNPDCRHEYYYLNYDVSDETIQKMQGIKPEDYFQWDSRYQYKDIVKMIIDKGKIRTVCPCCHQG